MHGPQPCCINTRNPGSAIDGIRMDLDSAAGLSEQPGDWRKTLGWSTVAKVRNPKRGGLVNGDNAGTDHKSIASVLLPTLTLHWAVNIYSSTALVPRIAPAVAPLSSTSGTSSRNAILKKCMSRNDSPGLCPLKPVLQGARYSRMITATDMHSMLDVTFTFPAHLPFVRFLPNSLQVPLPSNCTTPSNVAELQCFRAFLSFFFFFPLPRTFWAAWIHSPLVRSVSKSASVWPL